MCSSRDRPRRSGTRRLLEHRSGSPITRGSGSCSNHVEPDAELGPVGVKQVAGADPRIEGGALRAGAALVRANCRQLLQVRGGFPPGPRADPASGQRSQCLLYPGAGRRPRARAASSELLSRVLEPRDAVHLADVLARYAWGMAIAIVWRGLVLRHRVFGKVLTPTARCSSDPVPAMARWGTDSFSLWRRASATPPGPPGSPRPWPSAIGAHRFLAR